MHAWLNEWINQSILTQILQFFLEPFAKKHAGPIRFRCLDVGGTYVVDRVKRNISMSAPPGALSISTFGGGAAIAKGVSIQKETNIIGIECCSFATTTSYPSHVPHLQPWAVNFNYSCFDQISRWGPQVSYLGPRVGSSALHISSTCLFWDKGTRLPLDGIQWGCLLRTPSCKLISVVLIEVSRYVLFNRDSGTFSASALDHPYPKLYPRGQVLVNQSDPEIDRAHALEHIQAP